MTITVEDTVQIERERLKQTLADSMNLVNTALAKFPASSGEVAGYLYAHGRVVKGDNSRQGNPVAKFLQAFTGGATGVGSRPVLEVATDWVSLEHDGIVVSVPTPQGVSYFVDSFRLGFYNYLRDEPVERENTDACDCFS